MLMLVYVQCAYWWAAILPVSKQRKVPPDILSRLVLANALSCSSCCAALKCGGGKVGRGEGRGAHLVRPSGGG